MNLPSRASTYVLGILLIVLAGLVYWLMKTADSPALQAAIQAKKTATMQAASTSSGSSGFSGGNSPAAPPVDPGNAAIAEELFSPENPPERDLEIVEYFLDVMKKATGSNPIGLNSDITDTLTGGGDPRRSRVFPPNSKAVRGGEMVDRWGTPLWFHPNSGSQMEIRSAGPDKQLFTADDIIRNPSPAGLGVTPLPTNPAPVAQ